MSLVDAIVILVIAGIVGFACWYVWRAKKKGRKCIGCPEDGCESCTCCGHKRV